MRLLLQSVFRALGGVYDEVREPDGGLYMRRWRIGPRWLPSVRAHHILKSDSDRHLHDHPFDFVSIMLKGSYAEIRDNRLPPKRYFAPCVLFRRAETAHRLIVIEPVWTLVLRGPIRRRWGFHTGDGWVYHRDYVQK